MTGSSFPGVRRRVDVRTGIATSGAKSVALAKRACARPRNAVGSVAAATKHWVAHTASYRLSQEDRRPPATDVVPCERWSVPESVDASGGLPQESGAGRARVLAATVSLHRE